MANFLSISPKQTKFFSSLFAWSQLVISATLDSVSAVSEGYQLNYCWILTLLSDFLKGLSHEIDLKNVDENRQILALLRAAAGF